MKDLIIIGSDSYIASRFYNSLDNKQNIKLFSRIDSGKIGETIINDLFSIKYNDFLGYNTIINFTAIVHQPTNKNADLYRRINTDLPIHLAIESRKAGIEHFIQMSTTSVYGQANKINDNTPETPKDIYGQTKLDADRALMQLQSNNFKISIIRPPMVYGGCNAPGNMMRLINLAKSGIPLPFKNIDNKRDFIHVFNLIECLSVIIKNKIFGIIIPTDKQPVSTSKIISYIKKYSSQPVRLITINKLTQILIKKIFPGYYYRLFDSLSIECNLPEDLYKPIYDLEDGIREIMNNH